MIIIKQWWEVFNRLSKRLKIVIILLVVALLFVLFSIIWYKSSLKAVSKESTKTKVTIEIGSSNEKIANVLNDANLLRSKLAFKLYVKLNKVDGFQAGDYELDQNMTVLEIIEALKTGIVMKEQVKITFVEGKNMRWIASTIAKNTDNSEQDVYSLLQDSSYIDSLISKYSFLTEEIKNNDIYYPLEGYLFPDTYFFDGKDVTVKEIFETMLDKMEEVLSSYDLSKSKYTIHELITLASIVELEGTSASSRKDVASVLYNRISSNMSLGSDVTTYYAYKIEIGERDLKTSELYTYNPYNTRGPEMFGKLPVGPICSPSKSSIEAAINPNKTNYLYFVADKNGKVYFASTLSEHEKIVNNLKTEGLWYEY